MDQAQTIPVDSEETSNVYTISDNELLDEKVERDYFDKFGLSEEDENNLDVLMILAKLMSNSERHQEVLVVLKRIAKMMKGPMTIEQLNSVAGCYKSILSPRRTALKAISEKQDSNGLLFAAFADKLRDDVKKTCLDAIKMSNYQLERCGDNKDLRLLSTKTQGDYYRYLSESSIYPQMSTEEILNLDAVKKAASYYEKSEELAKDFPPSNHLKLGLYLNYSVFKYEICKKPEDALKMALKAHDDFQTYHSNEGNKDPDNTKYNSESASAIKLLRDNIAIWSANITLEEFENEDGVDEDHVAGETQTRATAVACNTEENTENPDQ